jgi:hypothetical protein
MYSWTFHGSASPSGLRGICGLLKDTDRAFEEYLASGLLHGILRSRKSAVNREGPWGMGRIVKELTTREVQQ